MATTNRLNTATTATTASRRTIASYRTYVQVDEAAADEATRVLRGMPEAR